MKQLAKWLLMTGLLGMILSGCGTSENTDESTNGSDPVDNIGQVEENQEGTTDTNQDDSNIETEEGNGEENEDSTVRTPEKSLQYQVNGEMKEDTALLTESDNQDYSMYVLPGYELTAEEPNKDVLYLSENDQNFMRIELLPADAEWDSVIETAKSQLGAVNEDIQTINAPSDEFFKDSTIMEAAKENDLVTTYLIKDATQPIKLTIFSKADADYKDAFLQMGKSILKGKST